DVTMPAVERGHGHVQLLVVPDADADTAPDIERLQEMLVIGRTSQLGLADDRVALFVALGEEALEAALHPEVLAAPAMAVVPGQPGVLIRGDIAHERETAA